jgi:hypothetical protein
MVLLAALAWVFLPPIASGQASLETRVDLLSAYVWRGVTQTNRPVAEPAITLSVPSGRLSLSAGGWANLDLGRYDDASRHLSQSGGGASFDLSEVDPWAEGSLSVGRATLAAGVVGYLYPNPVGATSAGNTWEAYGSVGLDLPLAPEIALYYDVDQVRGAYVEAGLSHRLALGARGALELGAVAGLSAGQGKGAGEIANFDGEGFTHLDLSAGVPFSTGAWTVAPVLHLIVAGDATTTTTSPSARHDLKLWGGLSIAWSAGPEGATGAP